MNTADEETLNAQRAASWQRFEEAVFCARRGNYEVGNTLLRDVGQRHGRAVRERQKRELERYQRHLEEKSK